MNMSDDEDEEDQDTDFDGLNLAHYLIPKSNVGTRGRRSTNFRTS